MVDTILITTSRMPIAVSPPSPSPHWALFLDLDGTLLDIAPTPDAVVVPADLISDLAAAVKALGGALAIVSGRELETIDRLLHPLSLPLGSEHGALVRLPNGARDEIKLNVPEDWKSALSDLAARCSGVFAEIKSHNVVAHYRNAPAYEGEVRRLVDALIARDPENFELLEAKMALEIRPRAVSKGRAVCALMDVAPFHGRIPVFVGDDTTDHEGFAAALALGGIALDVDATFAGQPREVRHWLKRFSDL